MACISQQEKECASILYGITQGPYGSMGNHAMDLDSSDESYVPFGSSSFA
jgi:hypothetical protein